MNNTMRDLMLFAIALNLGFIVLALGKVADAITQAGVTP